MVDGWDRDGPEDSPWYIGYIDGLSSKPMSDNPFPLGSMDWYAYVAGWAEGKWWMA